MLPEEGVLSYLGLDKLNGFLHLVENSTLESHILDDVHLCAHFLIYTLISYEAGAGTREELLWILAKQQIAGASVNKRVFVADFIPIFE